ncbi:DMT family transporter [Siccirubricoccus deserti]
MPEPGRLRDGLHYLAISVVLFGGIWPVTKAALAHATPLWFAFNRAAMAGSVVTLLLAAMRRLRQPAREDWPSIIALGTLQLGGFFALAHLALDYIPAGRTAILANVTIFWLIPLSVWLLGERVAALQWLATLVGLAGVVVLMQPWAMAGADATALLPGYAMLLLASLFWSLAILVTRRFPPRRPVLDLLPWSFGLGAAILLPLALWRSRPAASAGSPGRMRPSSAPSPRRSVPGRRSRPGAGCPASWPRWGSCWCRRLAWRSRPFGWARRWAGTCWRAAG